MYKIMDNHYGSIKQNIGIKEAVDNSDSDDLEDRILNKLRPMTTTSNKAKSSAMRGSSA